MNIDLVYPRNEGNPDRVTVTLLDVRAADCITVLFDFDRNGWAVLMDETTDRNGHIETVREDVEVAFLPAWNMPEGSQ